jgi:prepilin-type processing-associated H-X9-DG protein
LGVGGQLEIVGEALLSAGFFRPATSEVLEKTHAEVESRRHGPGWNVIFVDGHVENLKKRFLFSANPVLLRRWNRDNKPHVDLLAAP